MNEEERAALVAYWKKVNEEILLEAWHENSLRANGIRKIQFISRSKGIDPKTGKRRFRKFPVTVTLISYNGSSKVWTGEPTNGIDLIAQEVMNDRCPKKDEWYDFVQEFESMFPESQKPQREMKGQSST